jgi:hypothetical protein
MFPLKNVQSYHRFPLSLLGEQTEIVVAEKAEI